MGVEQRHALNLKALQGNLDYLPKKDRNKTTFLTYNTKWSNIYYFHNSPCFVSLYLQYPWLLDC